MTPAPAQDRLRILALEPVVFCCGEVLPEPQVWVLAEDRAGWRFSCRVPVSRAAELDLAAGAICRRAVLVD